MSSNRARGRALELKVKRYYEALGYNCQLAPMPTRWSLQNDLWGLWDVCAVRSDEILFLQVKMNRSSTYGKKLDEHRMFVCPPNCRKILVLWEPNKREPEITELTKA